jgi:hypothetical protein
MEMTCSTLPSDYTKVDSSETAEPTSEEQGKNIVL